MPPASGNDAHAAAGGHDGIVRLVDAFYRYMNELPEARTIRAMHDADLTLSRAKLTAFLEAWLGGPNRYAELFGPIAMPRAHAHLAIDEAERDAWLTCMACAVDDQPWDPGFKAGFLRAIAIPAERVRLVSVAARRSPAAGRGA